MTLSKREVPSCQHCSPCAMPCHLLRAEVGWGESVVCINVCTLTNISQLVPSPQVMPRLARVCSQKALLPTTVDFTLDNPFLLLQGRLWVCFTWQFFPLLLSGEPFWVLHEYFLASWNEAHKGMGEWYPRIQPRGSCGKCSCSS